MKFKRKIQLDRIGSSTAPARVGNIVEVSPEIDCREGAVIAARALSESQTYGNIELPNGRLAKVVQGNLLVGVLGARNALHGYMGYAPTELEVGESIHLLNMGGVMGVCDAPNKSLGPPIQLQVLGQVSRGGKLLNIADFAIDPCDTLNPDGPPCVLIVGTCMNSGKTFAAAEIIRIWSHAGVKVAAGKLTGVAAMRDLLAMQDNGAVATCSFLQCGLPSTVTTNDLGAVARACINKLDESRPDVIMLELGDGIIGGYNTEGVLNDPQVQARTGARVLCANDLVGAWGGVQRLEPRGHRPDVISGPVTDNAVGTRYIEGELKIIARNARLDPRGLAAATADAAGIKLELPE